MGNDEGVLDPETFQKVKVLFSDLGQDLDRDIDARNQSEQTPLMLAASHFDARTIRSLILAGANVNATDGWRQTPLIYAARDSKSATCVQVLIDAGAELHMPDADGSTALHWAAQNKNPEVVCRILLAGVSPNLRSSRGFTPLHIATRDNSNPNVAAAIVIFGGDPSLETDDGKTPVDFAEENESFTWGDVLNLVVEVKTKL